MLQIPIGAESDFQGIIDLVNNQAILYKNDDGKMFEITDVPGEDAGAGRQVSGRDDRKGLRER